MYNKVILVGRLTADPELRQTPNGVSVTSFSIAVNRPYTNKQTGDRQTDFIDIVAWRNTAEFICRYFSKGRAILVEGELQTRSYVDKQGQNRRAWEVLASNVHFVESKNAAGATAASQQFGDTPMAPPLSLPANDAPAPAYSSGTVDDFAELDDDGDLPF